MTTESVKWQESNAFDDLPEFPQLGMVIRSWRKCEELVQEELASKLGISKQLLSRYERGEQLPSLQKTIELANLLGAPVAVWLQHRLNDEMHQLDVNYKVVLETKKAV